MATEYNINKTTCLKEGQLWMNLVEFLDGTDEESSNDSLNEEDNETMKLKREDMPLFGICPSRDEVYFVVCEHCKQVFKPQALVHHIERRHSNHVSHTSTKLTQSSLLKANGKNDLKINELNGSETKLLNCANSSVNAPLNAIVETNKNSDNVLKSDSTANSSIGLEPTGPGPGPGPDPGPGLINVINSNCDQKTIVKTAKKKSYKKSGLPSTRKLLPCKDREYDANKHCGVWLPDMEKPCTRSLTCKTHSLTLRRAVQGRIKNFDELLAEHRAEKEEALRAQGIEVKPTKKDLLKMQRQQQLLLKQQKLEASQSSKCNNSSATKQTLQIHTETNINLKNSSITKENVNCSVNTTLSSSTLSQQSQPINVHMNHHPQPVALCNYNVRRISSCVRLTNRKWDLTASLLMSAFNSPKVKNVIGTLNASEKNNTNNNLSSYTTNSIKNSILNNQLSPLKKLHVELNPLELQTQSDPYNFPDAAPITNSSSFNLSSFNSSSFNSSSFTLIKPKTPTAKNSFLPSVNKKRKNDTNTRLNSDQHSSLLNGQLSQSLNKKACVNSKRSNNNSNKKMKTNISSINLPTTNSQDQQIFHSSTSLNTLHNKNLNDLLSNSNDTYPDNGSILLNGSLLSNHILDNNKGIYKNTNTTLNMNKSLCKKGSPSTISSVNSISQAKTINKQTKPLVIPSQSQHSNQNVMIESTQSSQSHQMLSTTLPSSKFLMTKSDEFPT